MRVLRALVTIAATLVGWIPSIAAAQSLPRLSYVGDARCPSSYDFTQQLFSRSRTLVALGLSQIRVSVVATEGGYLGRLDLVDPQGNRAVREFSGPTCSEITQAIALVAAVTIEGSTTTASATAAEASAPHGIAAPPKIDSPLVAQAKNSADSPAAVVTPIRPERPDPAREQSIQPFSIGAVAGLHTAISPYVTPTFGLTLSYRPSRVWGSPKFQLGAVLGKSRAKAVLFDASSTGKADFLWLAARTLACPVRYTTGSMHWGPCALVELGALRGSGSSTEGEDSSTGWWVAPGVVLDWSLQFNPIALSVTGGIVRPLVREHFKFQPDIDVFRPSNLGLLAEVGLAWAF